jgi:superfamily II RNA helicase
VLELLWPRPTRRDICDRAMPDAPLYACLPPSDDTNPDTILSGFLRYTSDSQLTLYPHQEEAMLAVFEDKNVIVHTPTGSGKSLIATAVHFKALAEGRRSFYTCPIKALVSEKFFALCRELGPERVGMMTGDATVNRDAPIICCTAEILANMALASGADADVDHVVMDEFHYFSDKERGVAWQIPLLTLSKARFVLMSATLGDVSPFERLLSEQTSGEVVTVRSAQRPVPLRFEYKDWHLHEAIQELMRAGRAPIYVVSFTQRGAAETAQSLLSLDYCTKEEKKRIAEALAGESFRSPHGKEMQKLLRHGIGLHHAGLLPRYRLMVEKLAQRGMLKLICGTDTLGVGVNVPIRTVLLTKLCKYDGDKVRILPVRDFQQIAGRAGRKGFDNEGFVVALAPEHVVDNIRLESKAASDPAKRRKIVKKKAPDWGYVHWDKATFERLVSSEPEPLVSRFRVSHSMLLQVLGRAHGGCSAMKDLVRHSLEPDARKRQHKQQALAYLRSMWEAGILEFRAAADGGGIRINGELQREFSLLNALGLYVMDAAQRLDRESLTFALDVLTLVEAVLEDPEVILQKQVDKLKTQKLGELKAAGVEYEERMAELDKVEHPKPNAEFLYESFSAFAEAHPWVIAERIRPKSIARELIESCHSFSGYIKEYGLSRSEGVLLRYLSEVYKTLVQTVPETLRTPEIDETIATLGALIRGVDSSLLDEWERLQNPTQELKQDLEQEHDRSARDVTRDVRVFTALVRNLMFSFLRAVSSRDHETAIELFEPGELTLTPPDLERFAAQVAEHGEAIQLDARARHPENTTIERDAAEWRVTQNILLDDEVSEFVVRGRVDLGRSAAEGRPVFLVDQVGS